MVRNSPVLSMKSGDYAVFSVKEIEASFGLEWRGGDSTEMRWQFKVEYLASFIRKKSTLHF
jgi:hypothetical protein